MTLGCIFWKCCDSSCFHTYYYTYYWLAKQEGFLLNTLSLKGHPLVNVLTGPTVPESLLLVSRSSTDRSLAGGLCAWNTTGDCRQPAPHYMEGWGSRVKEPRTKRKERLPLHVRVWNAGFDVQRVRRREGVRSEKDRIFDGAGSWIARAQRIKIIRENESEEEIKSLTFKLHRKQVSKASLGFRH